MKASLMAAVSFGLVALAPTASMAQHRPGHGHLGGEAHLHGQLQPHQHYAGHQLREVSSFSAEEVRGHLEGRGMGYALPAEINGYPGPLHVLELKEELGLTSEQITETERLFRRMQERAKTVGQRYIAAEKAVDAAFRSGDGDAAEIAKRVRKAEALRAETRLAHLEAHVEMAGLLSTDQVKRYAELRGYRAKEKP